MSKYIEYFGWANLIAAIAGIVMVRRFAEVSHTAIISGVLMFGIMTVISSALVYTCRQKTAGSDIGTKAYPAALVSYLLFALICYRWLIS